MQVFVNLKIYLKILIKLTNFIYIAFFFSYWKSRLPRQGWLYLSINHMCFYAYILARETKLIIRWADITELSKTNSILFPDSIRVVTRENKEVKILLLYCKILYYLRYYIFYNK